MTAEDRIKGKVSSDVYWDYIKLNGGKSFVFFVIISQILSKGSSLFLSIWLSFWTQDSDESKNTMYLIVFSTLTVAVGLLAIIRTVMITQASLVAAKKAHKSMIVSLLFAPLVQFFERVPIGRILNRLSKDLTVLDQRLGWYVNDYSVDLCNIIGNPILITYASSIWVIFPRCAFFYLCNKL